MNRPIAIGLSPNIESDDVWGALSIIVQPWRWKIGVAQDKAAQWFKNYFDVSDAVSFNSGRSAELAILTAMDIGKGDEVIVQAFTCVAVPNSVLWSGAIPVYVDIDDTLNIDPKDLERKITKNTKAIIVQHTFGIPAQIEKIKVIAKKHDLFLIEDCAHSLGATYKEQKIGSFGDAAFFSFGRDKVISSVFGGMAITNNKILGNKITQYRNKLSYPSYFWILQQLLHPIAFSVILPLYGFLHIGKLLLVVLQKISLLSLPVYPEEKYGKKPEHFPSQYPNALAELLLVQLGKLERFNKKRQEAASYYEKAFSNVARITSVSSRKDSIYLRFPILIPNADLLLTSAKKQGIILGNWYQGVIAPTGVDFAKVNFESATTPHALVAASHCVNLPTYPSLTLNQQKAIVDLVENSIS